MSINGTLIANIKLTVSGELVSPELETFFISINEEAEQRIADSHDITKSNFGFK